jgi:uncharacterized protein (TIGR02646 family)
MVNFIQMRWQRCCMIKLRKGHIPAVLGTNAAAWTKTLVDHESAGTEASATEKSRYRHIDIKAALIQETAGKCAYCESKILHVTYGDVEHIVPKSLCLEKTFEWENLTLACDVCNTKKANHFGNHDDFVDPYVVDPREHFNFLGATILPKLESNRAFSTYSTLKLNRPELLERRSEHIEKLCKQLMLFASVADASKKAILKRDLLEVDAGSSAEFSAFARAYIESELANLDAQE